MASSPTPTVLDYLKGYILPLPFFLGSLFYFILTFLLSPTLPFHDFSSYKERAFARLWTCFGPLCARDTPPPLFPLLAQSKGLILDVGPGTGEQIHRFTHPENIVAIYGVEPGISMHEQLKQAAKRAGFEPDRKYRVLGCTADLDALVPALMKDGLLDLTDRQRGADAAAASVPPTSNDLDLNDLELFDEIVCLRVLCGVPDQPATVADLYTLLKPGGRFLVCEHVLNKKNVLARAVQYIYMDLGWKQLMGGCELTRDTMGTLLKVAKEKDGGWERVDVEEVDGFGPLVHVVGVLVKKKDQRGMKKSA
ncbi:hypothetical protein ABEF95_009289 [Exophiala dermatitidis]